MGTLSPNDIGVLIYMVGGWGPPTTGQVYDDGKVDPQSAAMRASVEKWLDTAIAVCLAESNGNPNAKNSGSSASGMWQIMVSVHTEKIAAAVRRWTAETASDKPLTVFDPRVNTDVARMISQEAKKGGRNEWSPWEAYNTGAYKSHTGHGKSVYKFLNDPANIKKGFDALMANVIDGQSTAEFAAMASPFGALTSSQLFNNSVVESVMTFAKEAGVTIGVFLLGVVMLILGLWFVISQTKAGKTVIDTAKAVAP